MNAYEVASLAARLLSYVLFATAIPIASLSVVGGFQWIYHLASDSSLTVYWFLTFLHAAVPALFVLTAAVFVRVKFADLAYYEESAVADDRCGVAALAVVPLTLFGVYLAYSGLRELFGFLQQLEWEEQSFGDLPSRWAYVAPAGFELLVGGTLAYGAKYWMQVLAKIGIGRTS